MEDSISVVITTYNRSRLVGRAIESALSAIGPGDEIIVIDDGSTDDTSEVLRPYYGKIRYIRIENAGPGAARNMGIDSARRPLIAFLDSDDEWLPDKLYLQRKVMQAFPKVVYCFSDLCSRHPDGKIIHKVMNIWKNDLSVGHWAARGDLGGILGQGTPFSSIATLPEGQPDFNVHVGDIYAALMEVYYVSTITIMVRKEAAGESFRFPVDTNIYEEWECFGRLAKCGPAAYLDCETAVQNVHADPRLTDVGGIQQSTARIKLLHRLWGADESFMKAHSSRFQSVLKVHHLRRAKYLIKAGRTGEAKEDLKAIGGGPWSYRLLTSLPAPLINSLVGGRRILRGFMSRSR